MEQNEDHFESAVTSKRENFDLITKFEDHGMVLNKPQNGLTKTVMTEKSRIHYRLLWCRER